MASVKFYLDTRSVPPDVPAPLKIMITHNRTTALHSVDIRLLPSQWDGAAGCVTEHPQRMFLNAHLFRMRSDWEIAMLKLADSGEMRRACSAAALRDMLLQTLYPEKYGSRNLFLDRYKAFTESRATPGTRRTYAGTIPRIEAYDPMIGTRTFEDIDRRWLAGFEEFLSRTARSANARAIHFRNIRAVFNDAINDDITTAYPFRKFKIRQSPTSKRALTAESLRLLASYPCEEYQVIYRDMFVLMFCLIGINAVDLFNAPADAVTDGRLEYTRAKTHKPYSVKVEPEAAALIEKYRGKLRGFPPQNEQRAEGDRPFGEEGARRKEGKAAVVPADIPVLVQAHMGHHSRKDGYSEGYDSPRPRSQLRHSDGHLHRFRYGQGRRCQPESSGSHFRAEIKTADQLYRTAVCPGGPTMRYWSLDKFHHREVSAEIMYSVLNLLDCPASGLAHPVDVVAELPLIYAGYPFKSGESKGECVVLEE